MATKYQQFAKIAWLFGSKLAVRSGNGIRLSCTAVPESVPGRWEERGGAQDLIQPPACRVQWPRAVKLMGKGHGNSRLGGRRRGIGRTEKLWAKIGFSPR